MMTVEKMLSNLPDKELLDVYLEIHSQIVPATGYAHSLIRRINRMIDKGELCINPTTYRKVYLPTLVKLLEKELARRYVAGLI